MMRGAFVYLEKFIYRPRGICFHIQMDLRVKLEDKEGKVFTDLVNLICILRGIYLHVWRCCLEI